MNTSSSAIVGPFGSKLFPTRVLDFQSGPQETVVLGGRDKFHLVPQAFDAAGIKQILFIGWGSQGPAQSQNLRDTLRAVGREDIKVVVGLRPNSKSIPAAKAAGFSSETGTLGDPYQLAGQSDLTIGLISDGAMVENYYAIMLALKRGSMFGISHGFIAGHLESIGRKFPVDHDILMVAPKGMGPSVRKLYLQGEDTEGAGINSSVAIQPQDSARADLVREVANAWSVGIGSPVTFGTTFLREVTSDLFGERSMLLGGLWATAEALFEYYVERQVSVPFAFGYAVSGITGTVTDMLSKQGILGFYEQLVGHDKDCFAKGYAVGFPVFNEVMMHIYEDVSSFVEIARVIEDTANLSVTPMGSVEEDCMAWKWARETGRYGERPTMSGHLAFSAGVYVSGLMAQLLTLLDRGHNVSEVINESYIEAIDSLTPYMDSRGVAFMVDNCSTTARLGTRRWGPVFKRGLLKALERKPSDQEVRHIFKTFRHHNLHHDIGVSMDQRPSVRIDVPLATN